MYNNKFIAMKKLVLMFSVLAMLIMGNVGPLKAQAEEKEKKDSISIDNADPVFYDAQEDENAKGGKTLIILGIAGGVVIIGLGAYLLMKKRKKK
jgi:LPXTG-motif cell wall-anchored protein